MSPIETVNRVDKSAVFIFYSRSCICFPFSLSLSGWGALGSAPKRNGDDNVNFVLALTVTKKHRKHRFHQKQCFACALLRSHFRPSAPPFRCRLRPNTADGRKPKGTRRERSRKSLENCYALLAVRNKSKLLVIVIFCAAAIFNFKLESGSEAE